MDQISHSKRAEAHVQVMPTQTEVMSSSEDAGIALHPQPVDDALDPLNWSTFHKHTILAIVMSL